MKKAESDQFRSVLMALRSRLRNDVSHMTDEALKTSPQETSGNLSNMPIHMADIGTENFDQEFTLTLIENEAVTLTQIEAALDRIKAGTFGRCEECGVEIPKTRLRALPYTRVCVECARKLEQEPS